MARPMMRALTAAAVVAALVSCARTADVPRPTHTFEPSVSPTTPVKKTPARKSACSLLTSDERRVLAGTTMNQVVPTDPVRAENRCQWVHSFKGARMTLTVEAYEAPEWAVTAGTLVDQALRSAQADGKRFDELRKAQRDIRRGADDLTAERACEIYWLVLAPRGYGPGDEVVYPTGNGRVNGVISSSCTEGVFTAITYTEFGLVPSRAIGDAVMRARETAETRAIERFGSNSEPTPRA